MCGLAGIGPFCCVMLFDVVYAVVRVVCVRIADALYREHVARVWFVVTLPKYSSMQRNACNVSVARSSS